MKDFDNLFCSVPHMLKMTAHLSAHELHLHFPAEGCDQDMDLAEAPATSYSEMGLFTC